MIAEKMIGVYVHAADYARQSQFDNAPVMARHALTPRLPAIHPFAPLRVFVGKKDASAWLQQVLLLSEELIACYERLAAELFLGEINQSGKSGCFSKKCLHYRSSPSALRNNGFPTGPAGNWPSS